MAIEEEIAKNRQSIRTDGYAMSIGEILNLYKDKEIRIRPEFQRIFRWPIEKQSRLIESLLLDIPLPPIFVSQSDDAIWEVVDGLQRLSTILKFTGDLRDEETGKVEEPSTLTRTKYIPSLEGVTYSNLPQAVKIQFKRARLDFRILLKESDPAVKFELFDRLNSGGVATSPQEVRSAILLMTSPSLFAALQSLRKDERVVDALSLTERQEAEQYDLELIVRFIVFQRSTAEELASFADIDTYLTDKVLELAESGDDAADLVRLAEDMFAVASTIGSSTFRRFDTARGRTIGGFSVSAFEAASAGIASRVADWLALSDDERSAKLIYAMAALWTDDEFLKYSGGGVRATTRAPRMPSIGKRIFALD